MATESVVISFRENGIGVIKRKIDELGQAANTATRGLFLLQRALFVIGGAGLLRGLAAQLDLLTSYENRLKLTTTSASNLQTVQTKLFDIASRSRTSFEGVSEIYNRTALSARALGRSQTELLQFTESVSQAAIISGASAREANAALVQLGQGIASNRLGGDELRSILEQLPFVADVIAGYLTKTGEFGKVGRGELRKLGTEGKLTASVILDAFKNSSTEIQAAFDKLTPTIGGAAEVFKTKWLQFLDTFKDTTGIAEIIARSIIFLANNMTLLISIAGSLAVVVASIFIGKAVTGIFNYINALRIASVLETAAIARLVRFRGAMVAKTAAVVASNGVEQAAAGLAVLRLGQESKKAQLAVVAAAAEVATQRSIAATTGLYLPYIVAKDNLALATANVVRLQGLEAAGAVRLAAAQGAAAGVATVAAGAQTRLGVAQAAQAGIGARLQSALPLLAGAFNLVRGAAAGLFAILYSNPITAVVATIVIALAALFSFGNLIKVTSDGVVGLKDAAIAAFQLIGEAISTLASNLITFLQPAITFIAESWNLILQTAVDAFNSILSFAVTVVNVIIGTFVGLVNGTIRAFGILPAAIGDIFTILRNTLIDAVQFIVNAILQAFYDLPAKIGAAFDAISSFAGDAVTYIVDAFKALPGAIAALAEQAAEFLKNKFFAAINDIVALLNKLPGISISAFGAVTNAAKGLKFDLPALPDFGKFVNKGLVDLSTLKGKVGTSGSEAGKIYGEEFTKAYSRDFAGEVGKSVVDSITPVGDAIIERSRKNLADKAAKDLADRKTLDTTTTPTPTGTGKGGGGKGGGSSSKSFQDIINGMNQEIAALQLGNKERKIQEGLLKIEKDLKRSLTSAEKDLAIATLQSLEANKLQAEILERIQGPRQKAIDEMAALNVLYDQGRISIQQYNSALLEMGNALNKTAGTFAGGFKASIGEAILNAQQFGEAVGSKFVGLIDGAADAIVTFAKTGKLNLKSLFQEFFAQLLKLAAQQLLLRFVGSFLGIPGGGIGGGGFGGGTGFGGGGGKGGGLGSLLGFASGGSILPSGPGSTDSQMIAFAKRPDERVDILTPGQQNASKNGSGGNGGGTTIVQSPPVNVAAVFSPSDIVGAFNNSEGETLIVNMLQRNASTVRRIVNG